MTVQFEAEKSDVPARGNDVDSWRLPDVGSGPSSVALYECYFSRQNRRPPEENELGVPAKNLALVSSASFHQDVIFRSALT